MPFNKDSFIDFCMRDVRAIGLDKCCDTFHEHIDHLVDTNSIHENISIIHHHGGFYYAVLSYDNLIGDLSYRDEKHFYAILAYAVLLDNYQGEIQKIAEKEIEENDE